MLNKNETKILENIESKYYMKPIITNIMAKKLENKELGYKEMFDYLYECILDSKHSVDELLEARFKNGEIKDINQTRKSLAGNY